MKDNAWKKTEEKPEIPGKLKCNIYMNVCT